MSEVVQYARPADSDLEQWGRDLSIAYEASTKLVVTSFVPASYKGKPQEAAAAIMTGRELGLSPLAALRSIDIIQGTPALRAVALRALVQNAGHEIWVEESTKTQAIVKGRRQGTDKVEQSVWTIDRARDLQLLSKDNWKKQPIAMLLARATSELARLVAADVLLGVPYSSEELTDLGPEVEPAPVKRASSTVRRRALPARQAEAEPTEAEPAEDEPVVEAEPIEESPAESGVRPFEGDPSGLTDEEKAELKSNGLEGWS